MQEIPAVAASELKNLRAKGINPSDAEIVQLATLGWKVENPETGRNPLKVPTPQRAGALELWPLSVQAMLWRERILPRLSSPMQVYATAYALAHSAPWTRPGYFAGPVAVWTRRVSDWIQRINATQSELIDACEKILSSMAEGEETDEDIADVETGAKSLLSRLEVQTGIPGETWATKTLHELVHSLHVAAEERQEEYDATNRESGQNLRDLILAVEAIEKRHQTHA